MGVESPLPSTRRGRPPRKTTRRTEEVTGVPGGSDNEARRGEMSIPLVPRPQHTGRVSARRLLPPRPKLGSASCGVSHSVHGSHLRARSPEDRRVAPPPTDRHPPRFATSCRCWVGPPPGRSFLTGWTQSGLTPTDTQASAPGTTRSQLRGHPDLSSGDSQASAPGTPRS